jgi:hypothetical protein
MPDADAVKPNRGPPAVPRVVTAALTLSSIMQTASIMQSASIMQTASITQPRRRMINPVA